MNQRKMNQYASLEASPSCKDVTASIALAIL